MRRTMSETTRLFAWSALALAGALLAGCATEPPPPPARVTLLPESGRQTAVVVKAGEQSLRLDQPYQSAVAVPGQPLQREQSSAEAVKARYPSLIALKPVAEKRFVLSFVSGTSRLTPESEAQLPQVLQEAQVRKGGEIIIVGHTDTTGDAVANDRLSLQRAQAIRDLLIARGFKPELIEAVGRGERELLVPTADNVDEPRNRRAELIVR